MTRLNKGMIQFALVRLAGLAITLALTGLVLAALLGSAPLGGDPTAPDAASIGALVAERLGVTLPLAVMALFVALAVGVPLGAVGAARGGLAARFLAMLADGALSLPAVFAGMLLVLVFTGLLRWLPQGGFVPWGQDFGAASASLVLPALAVAVPLAALILRTAARSFVGVADLPQVVAGRLWGLTRGEAIWRHGYPAALLPVVALVGRSFGLVVAGAMIVENLFYLPGLGRLLFTAVTEQQHAIIATGLLAIVGIGAIVRYLADLALVVVAPRLLAERPA
jgi:peptide/nickel transport system permease protein